MEQARTIIYGYCNTSDTPILKIFSMDTVENYTQVDIEHVLQFAIALLIDNLSSTASPVNIML